MLTWRVFAEPVTFNCFFSYQWLLKEELKNLKVFKIKQIQYDFECVIIGYLNNLKTKMNNTVWSNFANSYVKIVKFGIFWCFFEMNWVF